MTDTQLIAAAKRGEAPAWRELYQRWMPWVWRYAYSLVHDAHAAEDITSEAMTAWVRNFENTGDDAPQAAAWLRSVIRHKSADHHRRRTRFRNAAAGLALVKDTEDEVRPDAGMQQQERRQQVITAMRQLRDTHRLLLEWKYAEGLSVREIAQRNGLTEKAVEAALYRARREFRKAFAALEPDDAAQPNRSTCSRPSVLGLPRRASS